MVILRYFFWLALSVVLQVLLFNHMSLFGGIVFIYMIALLKVPVELRPTLQIVTGFVTGFIIDSFCNTPGMHALTAISVMVVRQKVLEVFDKDPDFNNGSVSINRFSMAVVARYYLTLITLAAILLYVIESFTLFNFSVMLTKVVISVVLTTLVAIAIEVASLKKAGT